LLVLNLTHIEAMKEVLKESPPRFNSFEDLMVDLHAVD
jgi:hypothetical protein